MLQAGLRPAVSRLYDPFDSLVARRNKRISKPSALIEGPAPSPRLQPGLGARLLTTALRSPGALNALIEGLPGAALGGAMLVLVWEDDVTIADAELADADRLCREAGGRSEGEAPARRWLAHRHSVSYRQSPMYAMGAFVDTMEVASPWSRLLPMYHAVHRALSPYVFVMAHFSHAYPDGGSIYFTFAGAATNDEAALEKYDAAWRAALVAVVDAGGTLSHHHGVGRSKAPAMRREQGAAIDVVRALKRVLDPHGILNPGALIGETRDAL
jgi:alkyldihydroxyacetonephosphate synthase